MEELAGVLQYMGWPEFKTALFRADLTTLTRTSIEAHLENTMQYVLDVRSSIVEGKIDEAKSMIHEFTHGHVEID